MSSAWPWGVALSLVLACLVWRRLLGYLRYFQQEGYDAIRFARWVNVRSLTDPALWLSVGAASLLRVGPATAVALWVAGVLVLAAGQPDPRRTGKIRLTLTWRATRVLAAAGAVALVAWLVVLASLGGGPDLRAVLLAAAALLAALPLALIAANVCLAPYEQRVQQAYETDARRRVASVHPVIVGITGSYGKSSSKAVLAHLLQFDGPTLAASGSINTLMGVTRHIRDELVHGHKYMVVEMGAFHRGSIRRLCELTPPSAGLITAVGDMHLERFGSTDEIVRAKSELAQAIPQGGWLVVNADSPGALRIAKASTHCRVVLYGETSTEDLASRLEGLQVSKAGTQFTIRTKERVYQCATPLVGRPIILNIVGAFTLATAMGVDPDIAVAALATLRPVSNRLELADEKGVTWIRDAYNSNQFGFRAALEVATALPANRRFLATPGVIELGPTQFEVNRALAREASLVCDNTLVVSNTNRDAFAAGHRDAGKEARLVPLASRADAFRWLRETVKAGDVVILENDLPDLYEPGAGLFWAGRSAS